MCRRHEQVLDDVVLTQGRTLHALAAATLRAVEIGLGALGVAARGDRDDDVLDGDEILVGDVTVPRHEVGAAIVAVLARDLGELLRDDRALTRLVREDVLVVGDARHQLVVLVDDLLALQGRETTQLHVEDRGGLQLVDVEQGHQTGAGILDRRRRADEGDDLVEGVEGLEVATQDVRALLGLAQAVPRTTLDDLDLVRDPVPDELLEGERARHAVDEREHVGAEGVLQLRVLVQLVQHDLRDRVALEFDDQAHARA